MRKANTEEALRVFHTMWRSRAMNAVTVKTLLKEEYDLELTVLANGEIKAESPDGKTKYSIK
jgi:hypothetical protein